MKMYYLTGASSTSWQSEASGGMKRTLNYTITINNPLIGKFSTATETQVRVKTVWLPKTSDLCLLPTQEIQK